MPYATHGSCRETVKLAPRRSAPSGVGMFYRRFHNQTTVARFKAAIDVVGEILDCFLVTGGADYLLRVVVADPGGCQRFVRGVLQANPGIDTSPASGTMKRSTVFPLPGF